MNTAHQHILEEDLALFALALMTPQEAAFAQAHLKHCDECRGEVARLQGDLVSYAFTAELQDPPAAAKSRLMEAVAHEKQLHLVARPPAEEPFLAPRSSNLLDRDNGREMHPQPRRMGVGGWAGWALAAGVALFAGWQFKQGQDLREELAEQAAQTEQVTTESARAERVLRALTDPDAMQVALRLPATSPAPPRPEGHASYSASSGELVFVASHLEPVEATKTYELWVLPANGEAPVAAGTFRPDGRGNASVVLPRIPRHVAAKGFGITLENEGGSTTPTLPILLAGS